MKTPQISTAIRRYLHYGPFIATFIIVLVTILTVLCIIFSSPINTYRLANGRTSFKHAPGWRTLGNLSLFLCFSFLTTYHFLVCIIMGPGFVKKKWKPENKEAEGKLQYCQECEGYKCPRSHHCRKCQRCVLKMDHHCPWINCCVGHLNHAHFIRFLFWAIVGCGWGAVNMGTVICKIMLWGEDNFILLYYFHTITRFILLVFAAGLGLGVSLAVGVLLFIQLRDVTQNTSNIEAWIIKKAEWRHNVLGTKFIYPYNLGSRWSNFNQVINFSNYACGDGYTWPVIQGTDQYTFTEEQRLQKQFKRERMVAHSIITPYNARFLSKLTLSSPLLLCVCTSLDEQYLPVVEGDKLMVSRFRKRWLYGHTMRKVLNKAGEEVEKEKRGWFPRSCAVEVVGEGKKAK